MTTLGKSGAQQARDKSMERKREKRLSRGEDGAERPNNGGGRAGSFSGMVNKGKELLGLNKEKNANGKNGSQLAKENESAIE